MTESSASGGNPLVEMATSYFRSRALCAAAGLGIADARLGFFAEPRGGRPGSLTLYGGLVDIWTNTLNTTNPTHAQVDQFGDNSLLSGDPGAPTAPNPYYYGYNTYHVQTDFEYATYTAEDTKLYTTRYWNKQFYQNGPNVTLTPSKPMRRR